MSTSASSMPQPTRAEAPFLAVPRDRGDEACEQLSPIAFKVWYRITRMTRGWSHEEALISYSDFMRACGLKRAKVSAALKELITKGFVRMACTLKSAGLRGACFYALIETTGTPVEPVIKESTAKIIPMVHQWNHNRSTSGTSSSSPVEPVAARQPAPAAAPQEAIETLIETVIENVEDNVVAFDASSVAPNGAALAVEEDELTLREKEDEVALAPLGSVSDSQALESTPGGRLHETSQPQEREVAPELESLWNLVRSTLRAENSEASYENWLAPLRVAGCEGTTLYLQSKTTYHAEHFQQRFATQASGELSKIIHRDAEVRCLPPPQSAAAALDEVIVNQNCGNDSDSQSFPEAEPAEQEKPLTLKALVARDLFHFPPTGWNKGAAKAVQNVVNQLQEAGATPEIAPRVIDRFKRERPTGSVYEFLMKLPALVAAVGGAY